MAYITDHAFLRYLERVKGIDIAAVRVEMMSPGVAAAIAFGADTVIRGDGSRFKLHGDVVQTVLAKDQRDSHRAKHGVRHNDAEHLEIIKGNHDGTRRKA